MVKIDREEMTVPPDGRPMAYQPRWRKDFPVDLPEDQYIARRDFTKFMVLTSLAFMVGQVWIGFQNLMRKRRGEPPLVRIASVEEVPVSGAVTFSYPDEHSKCVLVRMTETTFIAYSQECTHLMCAVIPEPERGRLRCPCHEGYFDLVTGRPTAGPPRRPLARIKLEFSQGVAYASGVELRSS